MSWFSNNKTAAPARSTIRQQEIGLLQRTMRDLQWTTPDETCVKTLSLTHCTLSLSIHVPQTFPQQPPVLRLLTPARHPWVDAQGFLGGCPAISNWNIQSPSLVSLIQFIETKFRENPPVAQQPSASQQQQPPYQAPQQNSGVYAPPTNYNSSQSGAYQPQPPPGVYNPNQSQSQYGQSAGQSGTGYQQPSPYPNNNGPGPQPPTPTAGGYNYNSGGSFNQPNQNNQNNPNNPNNQNNQNNQNNNMFQSGQPSPMNNQSMSSNHPNIPHRPSQPSPSSPQPKQDIAPGPRYASTSIQRPSTPTPPPEPPFDLAPIPTAPRFDPMTIRRLPLNKLEELDTDPEQIKLFVAQQPTISKMYEDLVKIQFEVEELEARKVENVEGVQIANLQYTSLKEAISIKEKEFVRLKVIYDQQVKKYSVQAYIAELRRQLNDLDDIADDLTAKFGLLRNPDENKVSDHLYTYEQNRRTWHAKSIVYEKLKLIYK